MKEVYVPHCSACFQDLETDLLPVQLSCGHLLCGECQVMEPHACQLDGTSSDTAVPYSPVLLDDTVDLDTQLDRVYDGVNTKGVLCKYVYRGIQCPDLTRCRYLHGLPCLGASMKQCSKCRMRFSSTSRCPFCQGSLLRASEVSASDFPASQAESLTSSLTSSMQSLTPVFPSDLVSSRQSLKDCSVLQSYVDLTLSDISEPEEVIEVPPSSVSLLQLLLALWQFFRTSALALVARLTCKRDSTMVFYD